MIPETLDGWTLDIVRALVEQGAFESDRFDFKETLPHPKDEEGKRRLRRDVPAFANSAGGFFVFGVKDEKGLPPNARLVGMPAAHDFPEHFGNYSNASEPSVDWAPKNPPIPLGADRVIHVVHIPKSARGPHGVFEDGRWWFTKRTNKGTEALSYEELRALFVDAEQRRANFLLFRSELHRLRELGEDQGRKARRGNDEFLMVRFETARLEGLLPIIFSALASSSWLVRHLDALRNAAQEANTRLSGLSPFMHLAPELWDAIRRAAIEDAIRITNAAGNVLILLDRPDVSGVAPSG